MKRPEQALHIAAVAFMRAALPPQIVVLHVPNGGKRTMREAALFKAMGVTAGAPDLLVILPNGQAAWIELKAPGGSLSEAQTIFRDRVLALGCGYETARSLDEVERILTRWLSLYGLQLRARTVQRAAAPLLDEARA